MKYSVQNVLIHPYLGFVNSPDLKQEPRPNEIYVCNEEGFNYPPECVKEIPLKSENIIIGIFGGSVADMYAHWIIQNKIFQNIFNREDITILNFSLSGWKQPQPLLALAYYQSIGQHFDYTICIDGFNEAINGYYNLSNGSALHEPVFCHYRGFTEILEKGKDPLSTFFLTHKQNLYDGYEKDICENWFRCANAMSQLSKRHLHVLQPTNFFGWKGDEGQYAWCREPIQKCYPLYLKEKNNFLKNRVLFLDASYMCGKEEEIFLDTLCHLTQNGNQILTKMIMNTNLFPKKSPEKFIYDLF